MNSFAQKLSLVLISAAVTFSGCTKKPRRPSPGETMLGPAGGADALNPTTGGDLAAGLTEGDSNLQPKMGGLDDGDTIRDLFPAVYFDYDSSAIKAAERTKLQEAQRYLNEHPEQRIRLEGHCDWRGTAEYNLALGDRRANAAKQYLTTLGVPASRIEAQSKGDLDATENAADSQMAKDRRVDLIILKK